MPKIFDPTSPALDEVIQRIGEEAAENDRERQAVTWAFAALKDLGIAGARIPQALGGAGLSLTELFDLVFRLGRADSNVAHALRNHFLMLETLIRPGLRDRFRPILDRAVAGELFGSSFHENSGAAAGLLRFDTKLTADGQNWRLNGEKAYSTGNLYIDHIFASVADPAGNPVNVLIPARREGIEHLDDWDGIGQRLTASGTTRYIDVRVGADEIQPQIPPEEARAYPATFPQVWLTTVVAGVLSRAIEDVTEVILARKRNYYHGLAERPADDALIQHGLGRLAAQAHVAEVAIRDAAAQLDRAWEAEDAGAADADRLTLEASLAAAKSKVVIDDLAQWVGSELFELTGASGATRAKALDRHWRNARTVLSHNPKGHKARVIGDYLLNGVRPPNTAYF